LIDILKIRDYCRNPAHPEGRHKARVFKAALNIRQGDAAWLDATICDAILDAAVVHLEQTAHGWRYDVDIEIRRDSHVAIMRTGWIARAEDGIPRLTTCFLR
jgi:hypothetical protein